MYQKRKLILLPAFAAGVFFLGGVASAAPISGAGAASSAMNLYEVLHVHGCHQSWERGPGGRLHRHRRGNCARVNPREFRERPGDWQQRACVQVGPVWVCER